MHTGQHWPSGASWTPGKEAIIIISSLPVFFSENNATFWMIAGAVFLFNYLDSISLTAKTGLVCGEGIPHMRSGIFFSLGDTSWGWHHAGKRGLREKCQEINACWKNSSRKKVSRLEYQCTVTSLKPRWGFRVVQGFRAFGICSLLLPYSLRASLSMQGGPGSKGPRGDRGDRGVSVSNTICQFPSLLNLYLTNWHWG